jgi:hypothetical protein
MTDIRTISQLEAGGYPWIGCECCKGMVWVPFKMIRQKIPALDRSARCVEYQPLTRSCALITSPYIGEGMVRHGMAGFN